MLVEFESEGGPIWININAVIGVGTYSIEPTQQAEVDCLGGTTYIVDVSAEDVVNQINGFLTGSDELDFDFGESLDLETLAKAMNLDLNDLDLNDLGTEFDDLDEVDSVDVDVDVDTDGAEANGA